MALLTVLAMACTLEKRVIPERLKLLSGRAERKRK